MDNNELITRGNERIVSLLKSLDRMLTDIDSFIKNHKPSLNGERFLTDKDLSERLNISRRTLQDYRDQGRIPFYQLGGKILYRESDIQRILDGAYRDAYQQPINNQLFTRF